MPVGIDPTKLKELNAAGLSTMLEVSYQTFKERFPFSSDQMKKIQKSILDESFNWPTCGKEDKDRPLSVGLEEHLVFLSLTTLFNFHFKVINGYLDNSFACRTDGDVKSFFETVVGWGKDCLVTLDFGLSTASTSSSGKTEIVLSLALAESVSTNGFIRS